MQFIADGMEEVMKMNVNIHPGGLAFHYGPT